MKKQAKQALREMTSAQLTTKLSQVGKQLAEARLARKAGQRQGRPVKLLADDVAVIKTIMKEKNL